MMSFSYTFSLFIILYNIEIKNKKIDKRKVVLIMQWRFIPGYDEKYKISDSGIVINTKTNTELKGGETRGYKYVVLCHNGKQSSPKIHRLVAELFLPNPNKEKVVNHKDGNKSNNHISNLEWCSQSYNTKHSYENGFQKPKKGKDNPMYGKYGKENAKSKAVLMIKDNTVIKEFESIELALKWLRQNGSPKANSSSISMCCNGIKYKTAYGYKWKFKGGC